ncbi:hypothetical protein MNV49_002256 [Pseudohyphozyma bogoriensis]|nr:hypothetical protein MNV49_002256 [Pseudohyphozyma bogoriensis]
MSGPIQRLKGIYDQLTGRPKALCDFDELPAVPGMPQGCAWRHYAPEGTEVDNLGRLNLLTPEVVREAARSEIQTGQRVQLDWSLANVQFPGFKRKGLSHTVISKANPETGWIGCDDEIHFNTQCGSQWDGFKHVAHRATGNYYNGVTHEQITSGSTTQNGIDSWVSAGGIAGRAVLLDWLRWRELTQPHNPLPSPVTRYEIPHEELIEVAKFQGVTLKPADILIVRSGFVRWHDGAGEKERKEGTFERATYIGIKATEECVKWIWNNHFAAVAGDTVAFEAWPPLPGKPCLHEWLLAMWGSPIGEMWNLEGLSKVCEEHKRWSFFLTSAPLNVPGGVGSTPNVVAIF